jgi:DNA-directed RNA polymerase specialized sigma24 family protein
VSTAELLARIDLTALPPRERATLRQVGPALAAGHTLADIAAALGVGKDAVSDRVAAVRQALEQQAAALDADSA